MHTATKMDAQGSQGPKARPEDQTADEWIDAFDGDTRRKRRQSKKADSDARNSEEQADAVLESDPLLPEGTYSVKCLRHATAIMSGTGKLIIEFAVVEGPFKETILKAFYPVVTIGKIGTYGKFKAKRIGRYFEEMCKLSPDLKNGRCDRTSPRRMRGKVVQVDVGTVCIKWNGEKREPHLQYSVVRKLLRLINRSEKESSIA